MMKEISSDRENQIREFENRIGYEFKKKYILNRALTHSSFANQYGLSYIEHNERLEFLGDSVLSLAVSEFIFKKYRRKPEGKLTKIRASIVCEASLYKQALKLDLGDYLQIGKGEEASGGRSRVSLLADAYEAVIAAIYIDAGFDKAREFVITRFSGEIENMVRESDIIDYKSRLQEYIQKDQSTSIKYIIKKEEGPPHNRVFYAAVILNNEIEGEGQGKSKKEAEQQAAKAALSILGDLS
jgi:ribonuclease-3